MKFIFYLNFQILAFPVSGKPGLAVLREKQFLALGASVQFQTQGRQVLGGIRAQGHYVTWQVDCRRAVKDPFFMSERRPGTLAHCPALVVEAGGREATTT